MTVTFELQTGVLGVHGAPKTGLRKFGVPPGGPFDTESSQLANALLGNDESAPILEVAMANAKVTADSGITVALVGGGHEAELDGSRVSLGSRFQLTRGSVLMIRPTANGLRCYLALPGGVRNTTDLHSFDPLGESRSLDPHSVAPELTSLKTGPLHIVATPEFPFDRATVTARIDRVGIRLETAGAGTGVQSELSRPVVFGAVQLAPSGELLIHGPDGPTIGGYELLGVVARVHHDRLAQLRPGQVVDFRSVTAEEARDSWQSATTERLRLLDQARSSSRPGTGR